MISLTVVGLGFLTMGAVALMRPPQVLGYFGLTELTADLRNEVRAVYGGFGLAMGGLLLAAAFAKPLWPPQFGITGVIFTVAAALLGMAAGRIFSWCVESTGKWPVVFAVIEIAGGVALLAAIPA